MPPSYGLVNTNSLTSMAAVSLWRIAVMLLPPGAAAAAAAARLRGVMRTRWAGLTAAPGRCCMGSLRILIAFIVASSRTHRDLAASIPAAVRAASSARRPWTCALGFNIKGRNLQIWLTLLIGRCLTKFDHGQISTGAAPFTLPEGPLQKCSKGVLVKLRVICLGQ
jgi:hypothetical protein